MYIAFFAVVDLEMIEKVKEADTNHVHQGKVSYTARETIRNIVFIPAKTEISALPSKGLTKENPDHCDGCHLRVSPLDGNRGRVTITVVFSITSRSTTAEKS